jgi:hypothetical protein
MVVFAGLVPPALADDGGTATSAEAFDAEAFDAEAFDAEALADQAEQEQPDSPGGCAAGGCSEELRFRVWLEAMPRGLWEEEPQAPGGRAPLGASQGCGQEGGCPGGLEVPEELIAAATPGGGGRGRGGRQPAPDAPQEAGPAAGQVPQPQAGANEPVAPDPSAPLPERVRAAAEALRGTGPYALDELRGWRQFALELGREVERGSPEAETAAALYRRVWTRSRGPEEAAAAAQPPKRSETGDRTAPRS